MHLSRCWELVIRSNRSRSMQRDRIGTGCNTVIPLSVCKTDRPEKSFIHSTDLDLVSYHTIPISVILHREILESAAYDIPISRQVRPLGLGLCICMHVQYSARKKKIIKIVMIKQSNIILFLPYTF